MSFADPSLTADNGAETTSADSRRLPTDRSATAEAAAHNESLAEGASSPRPDYEPGDWTEWWCPTTGRWVLCPGPCPDGTAHAESRSTTVMSRRGNGESR